MRKLAFILPALILGALLGALLVGTLRIGSWFDGPDPESIATASLQSIREQSRLTAFSARFVSVVTSSQKRFGLTSQKTLIMPGNVRYEVDLARLRQQDVRWNEGSKTLSILLPALEVSPPEIDLTQIREYGGDGLLATLTKAEDRLDASNRQAGQQELMRQARQPMPMRLARDSAKKAVARSFAMPLRAAGLEANVEVRFVDEGSKEPSYLDRSRRMEDVLKERQQAR
jgi:hypothetical protein